MTNPQAVETPKVNGANGAVTQPSYAELQARILQLEAIAKSQSVLKLKVSEKGGLSVYGVGRFPVTLYVSQWERVIQAMPEIQAFIKAHPELSRKS